MSDRRMAEHQPDAFAFTPDSEEQAQFWLAKYPEERKRSAVIPLLWLAQKQEGWVSRPAMESVAGRLGMPYIRVLEVATFYTQFNLAPVGRHHILLCGTTPCMLRGAEALKEVLTARIGPKGATTADGLFTWSEVECQGACCNAPMAQISNAEGDHYYEDLTPESLNQLLDAFTRGETPAPGPQIARDGSAPEGDPTSLTDPALYDGSLARPIVLPHAPGHAADAADADMLGRDPTPGRPFDTRDNVAAAAQTPADDSADEPADNPGDEPSADKTENDG